MRFDEPIDVYPIECPASEAVGVPRRFGVGVLLILMTLFALLFGVLRLLDADARVFTIVAVLFTGVAAGQVLLFKGKRPRAASVWVGACLFPLEILAL